MTESHWLVHATREPSATLLADMARWWNQSAVPEEPADGSCAWLTGPVHTLIQAHVSRAAHKRRRRVLYLSRAECGYAPDAHGLTAMSPVIPDDPYGPEQLRVEHSAPVSSLCVAFKRVEEEALLLAVPVLTEAEFSDPDWYHEHSSKRMRPLTSGVVLPVLVVPRNSDLMVEEEATADRDDLLRAYGFTPYSIDIDLDTHSLDQHRELALVIEDVCDEIASIKADAAARVLLSDPLWPIIVIRCGPTWEFDF